ncbi:hypothetical protein EHS25_001876 [Saitozyma podzolica]|uniref:Uncharacterized protein n=1 Tax=Saitozyma podzolica TaxID=1890683 RepID=A0A427YFQ0_9TREE|nr:hypothetical protein EHS25_001876 [Saitozyma podzolica]
MSSPRDVLVPPTGPPGGIGADTNIPLPPSHGDSMPDIPTDSGIEDLTTAFSSTRLNSAPALAQSPTPPYRSAPSSPSHQHPSAPPSLLSDPALSGSSSTSVASLASSDDASSPPTSAGDGGSHDLYLQAKLSNSRAGKRRQSLSSYNSFGGKQSGMERLAAKKALARRLNA